MTIYYGSKEIKELYFGSQKIESLSIGNIDIPVVSVVTFTLIPDPADATVVLTAEGYTQEGNSISVAPGTTITYTVSKEGYTTQTGTQVCTINSSFNCTLKSTNVDISITMNWESGCIYTGTYEVYNNDGTKIGEFVVSSTNAGSSTIVVNSLDLPNYYNPAEHPEILFDRDFYILDERSDFWLVCSNEVNCELASTAFFEVGFKILDKTNPVVSFTYENND